MKINEDAKAKFERARNEKRNADQMERILEIAKIRFQYQIQRATDRLGEFVESYSKSSLSGSFSAQVENQSSYSS
jgi:transposase